MRVLFAVYAAKTHFYNMVPLAWALRAAGHDVRVASEPALVPAITRTGLTAVPVGDEADTPRDEATSGTSWRDLNAGVTETRPEVLTWDYVLGTFTIACSMHYEHATGGRSMLDDLAGFARDWRPDLVVWDALTFAGPVAAQVSGAAQARMLFGIDYIGRMYCDYARLLAEQPPERRDDPIGDWLAGRLARFDTAYEPGLATEMMTGQWTIDPTPSFMQFPLDLPFRRMRYVPYNGPSDVPEWVRVRPEKPRVCLTLGMTARESLGGDLFSVADMLEAVAELDIELVATLNSEQIAEMPVLPANVRVVDFVPLNDLLPSCSAIIHHGGFGTLGNAMVHGVPNIIAPGHYWDEVGFGQALEGRGAGLMLDYRQKAGEGLRSGLDLDGLRTMLARVLDEPSFRANSALIREEIEATPSPRDLARDLERLAAGDR
ncbi:activator-dependent family glycosyltransferase [Actinomadura rudentiformis]|uniref:Activator-dependent family glycosyltransferase n=1 Tax=Actinomadura rudentiformis TaxID=359158 RepID=A0A6H9YY70_9ACTN|nr:activator-dependent family glycosyltransferase [Actinomadura rudentiformis]KAB2346157.1 activator-dependent family glycosyltransferase [Actinomadura rudentiformis]